MSRMRPVALVLALVALSSSCGTAGTPPHPPPAVAPSLTDQNISNAQALLRQNPRNETGLTQLAAGYLQKVRETGDPSYYPKVESLLKSALDRNPTSFEATVLFGTLTLARHDFLAGLEWGHKAHDMRPQNASPYGVIVDSEVELGRYDTATADVQAMVNLRPDLASYSRVSYVRELRGDVDGAIAAMHGAVVAGGSFPENTAYVQVLLGNLYFNRGDLPMAEEQYRQALGQYPRYVHGLAAMGLLRAAQGRYAESLKLYQQAVEIYPLPQYVIGQGDVYEAMGDSKRAGDAYDVAAAEQQLYRVNGVDLDQELALFSADHRRDLPAALAAARRAVMNRPSVFSSDGLGWVLYQEGDYGSAMDAAQQALRLGTRDALFYYHRGMIESKLGLQAAARSDLGAALQINPHFSLLWAGPAEAELKALGG